MSDQKPESMSQCVRDYAQEAGIPVITQYQFDTLAESEAFRKGFAYADNPALEVLDHGDDAGGAWVKIKRLPEVKTLQEEAAKEIAVVIEYRCSAENLNMPDIMDILSERGTARILSVTVE